MLTDVLKYTSHQNNNLVDPFGRKMDYLRLAITDRCNLRCTYCMPARGINLKSHQNILSYEEMERLVRIFVSLGITKLRITGGEPFVRKDAIQFIKTLNSIDNLQKINITTNAVFIGNILDDLSTQKIGSLNISIDSLKKERFEQISRRDEFDIVWSNIQEALKTNLKIKLNIVVIKGINEDEIIDFCKLSEDWPVEIRFIEQMPFNGGKNISEIVSANEIVSKIKNAFPKIIDHGLNNSTARIFKVPGFKGQIGIIAGYSRTFCSTCNRLRITPDGMLKTCLYDHNAVDLRTVLRNESSDDEIKKMIYQAVANRAKDGFESQKRSTRTYNLSMAQIGG